MIKTVKLKISTQYLKCLLLTKNLFSNIIYQYRSLLMSVILLDLIKQPTRIEAITAPKIMLANTDPIAHRHEHRQQRLNKQLW
jgi:hypothetical protein